MLIRHGKTQGNLEGRYIGARTDEPLCAEGLAALRERRYPAAERVLVSPMRRCIETARLIYPALEPELIEDFRECDFGLFEGRNYAELNGRADYQAWIDSNGTLPFPGGESQASFSARCVAAFRALLPGLWARDTALVVHGGTIMAIMAEFARPAESYYDYQVKNGAGFILREDGAWERL